MAAARFKLALEQIEPSDWRLFETLAAEFLVSDYPMLRTTASPSGDGGRDGELFAVDGFPDVGFQYSVAADWSAKIKRTQKRLKDTFPKIRRIVFVSPRVIGAAGDALKTELWNDHQVLLDILDQSYFLERELTNSQRAAAAEELATKLVEPLLRARGAVTNVAQPLTEEEGRMALLHLTLDSRDGANDRSLTKSCFESLLLSILHDSDADNLRSTATIHAEMSKLVPHGAPPPSARLDGQCLEASLS